jgi:predicted methyltransferase MtxX (methanogen marker protein 4)
LFRLFEKAKTDDAEAVHVDAAPALQHGACHGPDRLTNLREALNPTRLSWLSSPGRRSVVAAPSGISEGLRDAGE